MQSNRPRWMGVVVLTSLVTLLVTVHGNLASQLAAKESALETIAQSAAAYFQSRCSYLSTTVCAVPACGSTFKLSDGFDCTSGYGQSSSCGSQCPGMTRSLLKSSIWLPTSTRFDSVDEHAFVASTNAVDSLFSLARTSLKAWQLIGDTTGVTRVYPGASQDRDSTSCKGYDARLRPWYVSGSSGPKDVVLLLDVSGSMTWSAGISGKTREELLRPAVDAILDTLTQNDFVSIVTFASIATSLKSLPVRGTAANIAELKLLWENFRFGGGTNFGDAFSKAFNMLNAGGDTTTGCTSIILFLTDGKANDNKAYVSAISDGQQQLVNANRSKAHVFAITMGSAADTVYPKDIACSNQGVYESLVDGVDPLLALRGYYQFLAAGLVDSRVRWTNPYVDAFGLGWMVTASKPIFDRSQGAPILVGVAAADVTLKELEANANYDSVVNELLTRSKQCPVTNFTECNLQQLRENSASGYVCPSPSPTTSSCRDSADAVTRSSCAVHGSRTLNDYLCTSLNSASLLQDSGSYSTAAAECCEKIEGIDYSAQCNGAKDSYGVLIPMLISLLVVSASLV